MCSLGNSSASGWPGRNGCQMRPHRHRPDAGTTPAVRNAERLVQIEMADIAAEPARPGQPDQRVEVGAVDVHLATDVVHRRADVGDVVLVHAVGRRIGNHQRRKAIRMLGDLDPQIVEVDVTVRPTGHHHDPHARQRGRRRVGAMSAGRNQADVAAGLAAALVVGANGEQPGVLPLRTGIRLQRHRVVAGESASHSSTSPISLRSPGVSEAGANGCCRANSGQVIGSISAAALSFIVHEPSGIMLRSKAISLSASDRR